MNQIARTTEFLPTNIESNYELGALEWTVVVLLAFCAVGAIVFAFLLFKNFSKYKTLASLFTSLLVAFAGMFLCLISAGSLGDALMTDIENQKNVELNIQKAYDVEGVSNLELKDEDLYTAEVKIEGKYVTVYVAENPETFEPTLSTGSISNEELDLLKIKK